MKKVTAQISTFLLLLSLSPAFAYADNTLGNTCAGGSFNSLCNLGAGSIGRIVGAVINLMFLIAAIIALFYLVLGGIKWVTSEGDTKNVEAARGQIIAASVGLGVTFLSYLIINLMLRFFLGTDLGNLTLPSLNGISGT